MMLSKIERRNIYWDAYFCCENADMFINHLCDGAAGVCDIIERLLGIPEYDLGSINTSEQFPEFFAQKPDPNLRCYWWRNDEEGWRSRQEALLKAIQLTY